MSTAISKAESQSTELEKQIRRGKALLRELKATLEDLEDHRTLVAAKRGTPASPAPACVTRQKSLVSDG